MSLVNKEFSKIKYNIKKQVSAYFINVLSWKIISILSLKLSSTTFSFKELGSDSIFSAKFNTTEIPLEDKKEKKKIKDSTHGLFLKTE